MEAFAWIHAVGQLLVGEKYVGTLTKWGKHFLVALFCEPRPSGPGGTRVSATGDFVNERID